MKKFAFIIVLLFSSINYSQVIEIERGKIEIVGLKQFTPTTLIDSLAKLHPGKPVHACASSMKKDFGFFDVSSTLHRMEGRKYYYIVTVIENDSLNNINYLEDPIDSLAILSEYKDVEEILSNRRTYLPGLLKYYKLIESENIDSAKVLAGNYGLDSTTVKIFSNFLTKHKAIKDLNLALWILNNDSNPVNNKIALSIITNFDNYDIVWWTLMNLQRRHSRFFMTAMEVLQVLSEKPRNIDWSPVAPGIRNILAGTNLFTFWMTLEILVKTNISPTLANDILKNNKQLLLDYLDIQHKITQDVVISFIRQISNTNKELSIQECKKWLVEY